MPIIEQFNGVANWTFNDVFSGMRQGSDMFLMESNGQKFMLEFKCQNSPPIFLGPDGGHLGKCSFENIRIQIGTSQIIGLDPNLELMANDGSWHNLAINWRPADREWFFGLSEFMGSDRLQSEFVANDCLKIRYTIDPGAVELEAKSELYVVLAQMFEDGLHSDMVLVTEGKEIKVSKSILAARSPVFAAMFEHKLEETNSGRVKITDVEYEPLRALIKFLYTDKIELSGDHFALKVFVAADKYYVQTLKNLVEDYISRYIRVANLVDALHISKAVNSELIKTACLGLIINMTKSEVLAIPGIKDDPEMLSEVIGKFGETINGQ